MDTQEKSSDCSEDVSLPHELANSYIALAELMNKQYEGRRALEWKIHIALWTLLLLSGYAFIKFNPSIHDMTLFIILFAFVIYRGQVYI